MLDIYKIGDKTQIFLIEIPVSAVDFFAHETSNIEKDITKKARENFDEKINSELIAELQTSEWEERTEFPFGMNSKGDFFYNAESKTSASKNSTFIENDSQALQEKPWWKFW